MASFDRIDRISAEVAREIDRILRDEVNDPAHSRNLVDSARRGHARFALLQGARKRVGGGKPRRNAKRAQVGGGVYPPRAGKRVELRYVPELIFEIDTNIEYAARINRLLKQTGGGEEDA